MLPPEDEAEANSLPSTSRDQPGTSSSHAAASAAANNFTAQMSPSSSGTTMAQQSSELETDASPAPAGGASDLEGQARPMPTPPPDTSSIIAHSPSASHPAASRSASPAVQYPTGLSNRRAACTHIRLTRIYGHYKCHHCGRVPRFGWVYRCTQDLGENLVGFRHREEDTFTAALQRRLQQESEARSQLPQIDEDVESPQTGQTSQADGNLRQPTVEQAPPSNQDRQYSDPELKPWMNRLISEGVYSAEQIRTLKRQRQLVLDRVAASAHPDPPSQHELQDLLIADPTTLMPGPGSTHYARRYRRISLPNPSRSRTTTISPYWQRPHSPRPHINRAQREQATNVRGMGAFGPHGAYTPSDQQLQYSELQQPSVCVYQTCSTCRPVTRDRTWQCLHPSHFDTPLDLLQLPDPAVDNRPVSHPVLVQSACYKFFNPMPIDNTMSSSMYTSGDLSDYDDDDDDDFDLTTSGYDSSEISPDNSSEGTPTIPYFDDHRGWDIASRWMAPAPTPPSASFRYGQAMPAPSVAFGNPLSGYGPSFPGQRRFLRRASSMDPRMLRSAREMAEMADIGLIGLGFTLGRTQGDPPRETGPQAEVATTQTQPQLSPSNESSQHNIDLSLYEADEEAENRDTDRSLHSSYSRSGAVSALDLRPSLDEQLSTSSSSFPAPGSIGEEAGEEVHVQGGIAVTEEAVESGEPDVVLMVTEEEHLGEHTEEEEDQAPDTLESVALFG